MKFRASRLALLEAFNIAGSIVSQRPTRPVLANIHLVVSSQGTAELRSTDQDTSIRFTVALEEGAESGEALLPAARVSSILKECGTDDVAFESDESGKVRIRSGRSRFQVLSENPAEFPDLPEFNEAASFGLEREKLHLLMSKTQFAIAKEKSRFAFNGARLDIEGNLARMIATDGKRLAMKTTPIDNSDGVTASPIVPARALTVFDRVFNAEDDIVRVALGEHQIMIKTARAEVSSVLVEGNFPNYKAVIPAETTVNIRFPREELMRAFRQASLLTSQETRSVRMKVASGKAVLTAQALDAGEATIEIDAPDYPSEEEFSISFNPDFFAEGLRNMDCEEITLGLTKPNAQAKITGEEDFVYVIMPVTMRNG